MKLALKITNTPPRASPTVRTERTDDLSVHQFQMRHQAPLTLTIANNRVKSRRIVRNEPIQQGDCSCQEQEQPFTESMGPGQHIRAIIRLVELVARSPLTILL